MAKPLTPRAPRRTAKSPGSLSVRKRTFPRLTILQWRIGPPPPVAETEDGAEVFAAHAADIPDIRDDLRTLGDRLVKLESLVATLEFNHQTALAELERKLIATQQRLEATAAVGAQLTRLEQWLTSGTMHKELQRLCEQQLTAVDQRVAELHALEARVRELVKERKA